jgi:hypothetical protein
MSEELRERLAVAGGAAVAVGVVGVLVGTSLLGTFIAVVLTAGASTFLLECGTAVVDSDGGSQQGAQLASSTLAPDKNETLARSTADDVTVRRDGQSRPTAIVQTAFRIAKNGNEHGECEDAFEVDRSGMIAAIADGASSSFGARDWAQALVDEFLASRPEPLTPRSFDSWLERCRRIAIAVPQDRADESWWTEAGSQTGAYAAFLGVSIEPIGTDFEVDIVVVGDCCAFVVNGKGNVTHTIPYSEAGQFGSHPALLGSTRLHPTAPLWTRVEAQAGGTVVLATDAVGEWLLGDSARLGELLNGDEKSAKRLLQAERQANRIVNDDMTLVVLRLPRT